MDSFFNLFDPSDGNQTNKNKKKNQQETVKKKPDAPKGRRGRKAVGKTETLPEESSFLCDPELSTELLVSHGYSYIDNYIEINDFSADPKTDADKKPKRRNSGRKNRRKKSKVSPDIDLPMTAWDEDNTKTNKENKNNTENANTKVNTENNANTKVNTENNANTKVNTENNANTKVNTENNTSFRKNNTNWNNKISVQKNCDDNIGKNVNKLKSNDVEEVIDKQVLNVIDRLERVNIKNDIFLSGDFSSEDLDNEFYSSEDIDDSDDSGSDAESSSEEVYGSLPPEPRFGNVEYKLQLVAPCERRFQHLVTQLAWRVGCGGGTAVYVVGVRDCGAVRGVRARALRRSLRTLAAMARHIRARLVHVAARRLGPARALAEVYIRKIADTQQSVELRVAVMGANEAGKSTLIGVLTQGELDNGRGSARLNMFRHVHEVKSGRTSSLSHEILGFDAQGNVINYGCSELMTAERIGLRSAKLLCFIDLAGHRKYQRTTLHGLTGYLPHRAMLVISATAGITPITEEHISLLLALDLPFFAVINKSELSPSSVQVLVDKLDVVLGNTGKKPLLITDEDMARACVSTNKINDNDNVNNDNGNKESEYIPVFPVSCVKGCGLNVLHAYLLALEPPKQTHNNVTEDEPCEFQIDEIFHVGECNMPVLGGLLARGRLTEGDTVLLGPLESGEFIQTSVRSIYRNRVACRSVVAGHSASIALQRGPGAGGLNNGAPRPGMVLLSVPVKGSDERPSYGGCVGRCKGKISNLITKSNKENLKMNKKFRRKNKNLTLEKDSNILEATSGKETELYKILETIEGSLAKESEIENDNLYKSDSDGDRKDVKESSDELEECCCGDRVLLDDPSDPRGCLYFQATIRLLRHSTSITSGFQCSVHVGNVRQTATIQGILSLDNSMRCGDTASVLFKFCRCPEYLVKGRRLLFTAGLGTRAIGRVTQVFPFIP